jgi:hypothetical protein
LTRGISLFAVLTLALCLWNLPETASADTYKYVDDRGRVHFTDSVHAIPVRYRDQVPMDATGEAAAGGGNLFGAQDQADAIGLEMTDVLVRVLDEIRKRQKMLPLGHAQKNQLAQFADKRLMGLLISSVILALFAIGGGIHGFLTAHPRWAIANLVLIIPVPIYVLLHVANDKGLLKLVAFAGVLVPSIILARASWDLYFLLENLLV